MKKLSMDELNRMSVDEFHRTDKFPLVIVLDNIRSMMNIGSVFRTADAFRVESIFLCGITATPPNREIHKTALGATESVDWKYFEKTTDAIMQLKKDDFFVVAMEQTDSSISLSNFKPSNDKKYAIVFGNEVKGVEDEVLKMCDACIEIPQFGTKHSLNIAVTAGMVVWDFYSKLLK
ncbi:MAG: RNA methyltransferase [Bacteroidetes bacterium]|nr:RNA methyltransferase [Bacteroidota bacterium]